MRSSPARSRARSASSAPVKLLDLRGDPRFEFAIPAGDFIGTLAQFTQQPRILHCDDRLRDEILEQRDLLV
jgi:hypothetical protein